MDLETLEMLRGVAATHPTPCFVVDLDRVRQRAQELVDAFDGQFGVSFAVKANPSEPLLRALHGQIASCDVSSAGELERSMTAGFGAEQISFTGPGKQDFELEAAVAAGVDDVVLESLGEARRLDTIAGRAGRRQRVLLRISPSELAPGFGAQMSGRPSAFGVDQEDLPTAIPTIQALEHLQLIGFHIFAGAQCLKQESLARTYRDYCAIFREAAGIAGTIPERLVFGAGMGIPYHANEQALDLAALAAGCREDLQALGRDFPSCQLLLELGRYLVGEAGYYLSRVVDKKVSRGTPFAVCDGGMNHNLAAAGLFGMIIPKNYPFFLISPKEPDSPLQAQQLVGPLCTSLDTMGRGVELPALEVGDILAMGCAGAYGASASPILFISHRPPTEVFVQGQGDNREILLAPPLLR